MVCYNVSDLFWYIIRLWNKEKKQKNPLLLQEEKKGKKLKKFRYASIGNRTAGPTDSESHVLTTLPSMHMTLTRDQALSPPQRFPGIFQGGAGLRASESNKYIGGLGKRMIPRAPCFLCVSLFRSLCAGESDQAQNPKYLSATPTKTKVAKKKKKAQRRNLNSAPSARVMTFSHP